MSDLSSYLGLTAMRYFGLNFMSCLGLTAMRYFGLNFMSSLGLHFTELLETELHELLRTALH